MTTEQATRIKKVCRIGLLKGEERGNGSGNIYIEATIEDGKLSIHGVIGPLSSGNAKGSSGQINMGFAHRNPSHNDKRTSQPITPDEIAFAPGWNPDKWYDFLDIWEEWHLNDMKAGCEHQRRDWDSGKELEIVTYRLNDETSKKQRQIKASAMDRLERNGTASLTENEQRILALPWEMKHPANPPLPEELTKVYKEEKRETKIANWVTEDEHPDGILSKPCPECGYKYGTKWLKVELPREVIEFIEALPETDRTPAWV